MTALEAARLHLGRFANPREAVWRGQQQEMRPQPFDRSVVLQQQGRSAFVGAVADLDGVHVMTDGGDLVTVHWEDLLDGTPTN